jgi:hypothetical protein
MYFPHWWGSCPHFYHAKLQERQQDQTRGTEWFREVWGEWKAWVYRTDRKSMEDIPIHN